MTEKMIIPNGRMRDDQDSTLLWGKVFRKKETKVKTKTAFTNRRR